MRYSFYVVFLLLSTAVHAAEFPTEQDKAAPCRPTVSCTADMASPGITELEAGYLYRSEGSAGNQSSIPFLVKFTNASWSQIQVGSNGYTSSHGSSTAQYFDDAQVGWKVHFLDQAESRPSISFSLAGNFPTAQNQSGYIRAYEALSTLYVSKDFGVIHADFNVGWNLLHLGSGELNQGFAALALSYSLSARWGVALESYYFSPADPVSSRDAGLRSAFSYAFHPWLIGDFGGDVGYIPSVRSYSLFAGLTIVPAVLWR